MSIERISASPQVRRPTLPMDPLPKPEPTTTSDREPSPRVPTPRAEPTEKQYEIRPTTDVEFRRRDDGGTTVTVYDVRTGQPVYQAPPEQAAKVIAAALERLEQRRRS
ncbi:MAG: hypothetical protein M3Q27_17555 [Actinomycetota bacterium]|nr:hypothetical protein [Actinomycetota bacterium]